MGRKSKPTISPTQKPFWRAEIDNDAEWIAYFDRLTEIAISLFEWEGLPETVDARFLELSLFRDGYAVFFRDDVLGDLALRCMIGGQWDVYDIPEDRRAYASNGYNNSLTQENSVLVFNNMLHTNSILTIRNFAKRLAAIDRTIDTNVNAQKTPVLVICDEKQRLTLQNVYKKYEGNAPVIYADKSFDPNGIRTIQTGAPYISDKLYTLKTQIWNEALTYLGVPNLTDTKTERMVKDEVTRMQGGTIASRYSRLMARQQACEQINKMFGLNVRIDYRDEYKEGDIIDRENPKLDAGRSTANGLQIEGGQ